MTTKNERRACARPGLAVCWALAACVAHAQPSPDTAASRDALEQQRAAERARAQRELLQPAPEALPPAPPPAALAWPAAESPCFTIREISLAGEASDAFGWTIDTLLHGPDAAIGRCLGAQGLDVAAQRAQQALLERGYVTSRILLPPQDVSQGRLVLGVVPGRIRAIRFADGTNPRANALNALPARPGDLLNLREIEQGLENFKRVPTVTAHIHIEPADAPGQSDLVIDWTQAFPFRLTGTLDDSGTRATGKYQASATLSYDHALTLNDLFYAKATNNYAMGFVRESSDVLSSTTSTYRRSENSSTALASNLGGQSVVVQSGRDTTVRGSNVVSDQGTTVVAGRDLSIQAATESYDSSLFSQSTTSGVFSSGGLCVTIGTQQQDSTQRSSGTTAAGSTVVRQSTMASPSIKSDPSATFIPLINRHFCNMHPPQLQLTRSLLHFCSLHNYTGPVDQLSALIHCATALEAADTATAYACSQEVVVGNIPWQESFDCDDIKPLPGESRDYVACVLNALLRQWKYAMNELRPPRCDCCQRTKSFGWYCERVQHR